MYTIMPHCLATVTSHNIASLHKGGLLWLCVLYASWGRSLSQDEFRSKVTSIEDYKKFHALCVFSHSTVGLVSVGT
jgi:hypothetical protein